MSYLSADDIVHATSITVLGRKRRIRDEDIRSKSNADFRETCKLRTQLSLPCRDCKYYKTIYCKDEENRNGNS